MERFGKIPKPLSSSQIAVCLNDLNVWRNLFVLRRLQEEGGIDVSVFLLHCNSNNSAVCVCQIPCLASLGCKLCTAALPVRDKFSPVQQAIFFEFAHLQS